LNTSITFGDYVHCRKDGENKYRDDGTEVLNMLGRLTSFVVAGKYKFANGYIMKENAKLAPYIYLGAGVNNISEHWWKDKPRAQIGNYTSLNAGLGVRYNLCHKFNIGYNMGYGYFILRVDRFSNESITYS